MSEAIPSCRRRVFAPKLLEALRRTRRSSESPMRQLSHRWRATTSQKVYSLKLYHALRRSRRSTTVREMADKVLATTARGTTRWSRAILVKRLGRQRRNTKPKIVPTQKSHFNRFLKLERPCMRRKVSEVGNRVRILGGLVPGCRRTALPELLDETVDYIAALEMQVRAMTALTKILSEFKACDKIGSGL